MSHPSELTFPLPFKAAEATAARVLGWYEELDDGPRDDVFMAAVLLLYSAGRLKNVYNMYRDTKYPKEKVKELARNARASGYWKGVNDRKVYMNSDWADEESGQAAFILDSMTVAGLVQFIPDKEDNAGMAEGETRRV